MTRSYLLLFALLLIASCSPEKKETPLAISDQVTDYTVQDKGLSDDSYAQAKALWDKFREEESEESEELEQDQVMQQRVFAWKLLDLSLAHQDLELAKSLVNWLKENDSISYKQLFDTH